MLNHRQRQTYQFLWISACALKGCPSRGYAVSLKRPRHICGLEIKEKCPRCNRMSTEGDSYFDDFSGRHYHRGRAVQQAGPCIQLPSTIHNWLSETCSTCQSCIQASQRSQVSSTVPPSKLFDLPFPLHQAMRSRLRRPSPAHRASAVSAQSLALSPLLHPAICRTLRQMLE